MLTPPTQPSDGGPTYTRDELDARFAWHADRAAIDKLLHFTHWIPLSRGFTADFLDENWPGWSLAGAIAVLDAAEIRVLPVSGRPCAPHGGFCHWKVHEIHFNSARDFFVEWNDLEEDDGRYLYDKGTGPRISAWFTPRQRPKKARRSATPVDLSGRVIFDD